ncbi:MAG TPA: hypothetical protein VHJ00_16915 [Bradyrhizobium sp.]|nr:hypothetical protein [Bradyrhizobium sp.]
MSSVNEHEIEDGVFEDVETPCAALVPVTATVYRAATFAVTRPNASFVTHLIATAEHVEQTRELRRAAPADALSAYRSSEQSVRDVRASTRQTI